MKRAWLASALLAAGCAARVPRRNAPPEQAIAAIVVGARLVLPSGETRNGRVDVGFETEGADTPEAYRLPLQGGEAYLFTVEPGLYRFAPVRGLFGGYKDDLQATIEGRTYRMPFPRELLRQRSFDARPRKTLVLGVVEATVLAALPGQKGTLKVRMDDSVQARRQLLQTLIRDLMDPRRPPSEQANGVAWSRALQNSLMELLAQEDSRPSYKPATP